MINTVKKHFAIVTVGIAMVAIAIVVVGECTSSKQRTDPESMVRYTSQEKNQQSTSTQKVQPVQQTRETSSQDTAKADSDKNRNKKLDHEIENLQKKLKEVQERIAQLRQEEDRRQKAQSELLNMFQEHSEQIETLGNTLHRVLKTPRQIRIIATDLNDQASKIRSQIQSQSRTVGSSSIDRKIWLDQRSVMEQHASDLEAMSLDLQRTQGNPSRVRIVARQMLGKAENIRTIIESKKKQKTPPNAELVSLEKQQDALNKKIQELKQKQKVQNSKEK